MKPQVVAHELGKRLHDNAIVVSDSGTIATWSARHLPIRRGSPADVGGLADHVNSPIFATAVGVVLYAHRNRVPEAARGGAGAFSRVAGRLRGIFKEFF